MRLQQFVDNGNVALHQRSSELMNTDNRFWIINNTTTANNSDYQSNNLQLNSNYERESFKNESIDICNIATNVNVCNRQYRLNSDENNELFNLHSENTETSNLEGTALTQLAVRESFLGSTDAPSSPSSPLEDERGCEQSDTDEMSDNSSHSHPVDPVPRGIVNPNYPGFQHFAHTLQDYSTNIDAYYHSENDMTDDDVDITDITEHTYDQKEFIDTQNFNNNNINETILSENNTQTIVSKRLDTPDLLKTVTENGNNNIISTLHEVSCLDPDVENNFATKDIIGNFNKEIEDEIRHLLNFNINIQNDLEELRKDIKVTLAKPLENTINNISEVVNHVIKKLVETQSDTCEQNDQTDISKCDNVKHTDDQCVDNGNENEKLVVTRTEMNKMSLTRPTFLLLDSNKDIVPDAYLSNGTEEINIDEENINPKVLIEDVEKTVQRLDAELRRSLRKLDESHESELYNAEEMERAAVITDGNSNEITQSDNQLTRCCVQPSGIKSTPVPHHREQVVSSIPAKTKNKSRFQSYEVNTTKINCRGSQNTSVHNTERTRDIDLESFDVYNIETALPKLDFDAIESHLKAAKEAERRKHNDREEIRRRLATGVDSEEFHSLGHGDRPGRKPSLQSRLQSGRNLQICYMNENASDNESQISEVESNTNSSKSLSRSNIFSKNNFNHPYQTRPLSVDITKLDKLGTVQSGLKLRPPLISKSKSRSSQSLSHIELRESDFYALQATLQTEARIALAQAKEMARVQMERERRSLAVSPVTEMLRRSMEKANAPLAADRRRVSRQLLTDMNVAQLQVVVNELHCQIEALNEALVRLLMARDELHMGQDSMLVDIEDLTRYLGVKEQTKKTKGSKAGVKRLTSFVHK